MRVALGSVCRKLLETFNIYIGSYVSSIYNITDKENYDNLNPLQINKNADKSIVRTLSEKTENKMINCIKKAKQNGDSVGGSFNIHITGLPYGLGSYTSWDSKLNASLGQALLSINGIKSFNVGLGSQSETKFGSNGCTPIQ